MRVACVENQRFVKIDFKVRKLTNICQNLENMWEGCQKIGKHEDDIVHKSITWGQYEKTVTCGWERMHSASAQIIKLSMVWNNACPWPLVIKKMV